MMTIKEEKVVVVFRSNPASLHRFLKSNNNAEADVVDDVTIKPSHKLVLTIIMEIAGGARCSRPSRNK